MNVGSEEMAEISEKEIVYDLRTLKDNKAPGKDDIVIEMIKEAEEILVIIPKLRIQFNTCLERGEILVTWNNVMVIILFKNGDPSLLPNYRTIIYFGSRRSLDETKLVG